MRRVVKAVFRPLSAFASTEVQLKTDLIKQWKQKDTILTERFLSSRSDSRMCDELFFSTFKLTVYEKSCFGGLQEKELYYYPNNSMRGNDDVLKMDCKHNIIGDQDVTTDHIIVSLKNIRFVNSIVFNHDFVVFLTTANYIQRLLNIKAVKRDLMPFICAAIYDLALEQREGKVLNGEQVALLLQLTNVPSNHIEDFVRMKSLLQRHLAVDLESILITDYLQLILRTDLHSRLLDLACVLATSCELTYFSLACQALSLASLAARHLSFHPSFSSKYASIIHKVPLIFVSPLRLTQFAELDNIVEQDMKDCGQSMVRYLAKYYGGARPRAVLRKTSLTRNMGSEGGSPLLRVIKEENERLVSRYDTRLDMADLLERLGRVSRHDLVKEGPRPRRMDDGPGLAPVYCQPPVTDDNDSAISSSSNMTSPPNSPLFL